MAEATAVTPEGRISPNDTGLWNDRQAEEFNRITPFISEHGAVPGVQLAHAGRKASTAQPWRGGNPVKIGDGGWQTVSASPIPFMDGYPTPRELTKDEIDQLVIQFANASRRAHQVGFKVAEIHMAHGYLMHQFLSPLSNHRRDEFGGTFEGRTRFPLRVARAVREAWPAELPLFVRISSTDWVDGGWDLEQSIKFSLSLKEIGIDLIDCSSGGLVSHARIPVGPGFQVQFAESIRREAGIATGAVGLITEAQQAEEILESGKADAVLIARGMLRDPYWPLHAAKTLGVDVPWPVQYLRAKL
jgi:2,4-dienoyl-CoA reductase-like NADH-dependent reductase (Old Yellow Enzyme family)